VLVTKILSHKNCLYFFIENSKKALNVDSKTNKKCMDLQKLVRKKYGWFLNLILLPFFLFMFSMLFSIHFLCLESISEHWKLETNILHSLVEAILKTFTLIENHLPFQLHFYFKNQIQSWNWQSGIFKQMFCVGRNNSDFWHSFWTETH